MASFYQKKSLEYTIKGLEILRNETIQLFQNRNNYLSFGTGAIALLAYSAATSQYNYPFLTYVMLLCLIPLFSCFLIIVSVNINGQIVDISRYLKSREMLITYILESTREYGLFNEDTPVQVRIRRKMFPPPQENSTPQLNNIENNIEQNYILAEQIPIYWERYCANPDPQKLKSIDLQSYLITWVFSIISIISYGVALVFKSSVNEKCCNPSVTKGCPEPDKCFNDIVVFTKDLSPDFMGLSDLLLLILGLVLVFTGLSFLWRMCDHQNGRHKNCYKICIIVGIVVIVVVVYLLLKVWSIPTLLSFTNFLLFLSFILIVVLNMFGEGLLLKAFGEDNTQVKEELTSQNTIAKDCYFLFLNLAGFLCVIFFLRFHLEVSIFVMILFTFWYTLFWQIPLFRKRAHKPLNEDIFKKYTS